jgi:hypothetical protein
MLDPAAVANVGGCDPRQVAGCGYLPLIIVVTQQTGGGVGVRSARNTAELKRLAAEIARDDEDILAVVIAAVHAGLIP